MVMNVGVQEANDGEAGHFQLSGSLLVIFELTNRTSHALLRGDIAEGRRLTTRGQIVKCYAAPPRVGSVGVLWPGEKYTGQIVFPVDKDKTKRFQVTADYQDIGLRGYVMGLLHRIGYYNRSHPLADRLLPLIVPETQPKSVHFQSAEVLVSD